MTPSRDKVLRRCTGSTEPLEVRAGVTWAHPGRSSDSLQLWGDHRSLCARLGTLSQTLPASRF